MAIKRNRVLNYLIREFMFIPENFGLCCSGSSNNFRYYFDGMNNEMCVTPHKNRRKSSQKYSVQNLSQLRGLFDKYGFFKKN